MAYIPILKGKPGEFSALKNTDAETRRHLRPLLEVVPNPRQKPSDVMATFEKYAKGALEPGSSVAVDWHQLRASDPLGGWHEDWGIAWLGKNFSTRRVAMLPVVRIGDDLPALAQARETAHRHDQGACLRLIYPEDFLGTGPGLDHRIHGLLANLELRTDSVDLLIDAAELQGSSVVLSTAARIAPIVEWSRRTPWRNRALAAAGFPLGIGNLPKDRSTAVPRWDAEFWRRVQIQPSAAGLDYADYGVTHPAPPSDRRSLDPSLRYTCRDNWQVYVWRKRIQGSNDDFISLAKTLVASEHWPPAGRRTSWGDEQIYLCSRHELETAGNATTWRAWSTSHHMATVIEELLSSPW